MSQDRQQESLSESERQSPSPQPYQPRSPAEWVSFGVASLVLAVVIGAASYLWIGKQQNQPPALVLTSSEQREISGQFTVPFTVTNQGGETAASVQVIAELRINGDEETGEQQIDFLSSGETARGAFVFSRDPRQGKLSLRVASYKLP